MAAGACACSGTGSRPRGCMCRQVLLCFTCNLLWPEGRQRSRVQLLHVALCSSFSSCWGLHGCRAHEHTAITL